ASGDVRSPSPTAPAPRPARVSRPGSLNRPGVGVGGATAVAGCGGAGPTGGFWPGVHPATMARTPAQTMAQPALAPAPSTPSERRLSRPSQAGSPDLPLSRCTGTRPPRRGDPGTRSTLTSFDSDIGKGNVIRGRRPGAGP